VNGNPAIYNVYLGDTHMDTTQSQSVLAQIRQACNACLQAVITTANTTNVIAGVGHDVASIGKQISETGLVRANFINKIQQLELEKEFSAMLNQ